MSSWLPMMIRNLKFRSEIEFKGARAGQGPGAPQGQTTAIQARGWGHAFPPYIVPSPKLLAPITKPLLSCNQKWGHAFPSPTSPNSWTPSLPLICNQLLPSPGKFSSIGVEVSDSPSIRGLNRSNSLEKCTRVVFGIAKLVWHWNYQPEWIMSWTR